MGERSWGSAADRLEGATAKGRADGRLVEASTQLQMRAVAALGAHPALMGGATGSGTVTREARRQLREMLVIPLGAHIAFEMSELIGEEVILVWPPDPDTMLVEARTEKTKAETEVLRREPVAPPPSGE